MSISSVDVANVGDEGGWPVTATGVFPTGVALLVYVEAATGQGVACYSGKQGQGYEVYSPDGTTVSFVTPPLEINPSGSNPYGLYVRTVDGAIQIRQTGLLTVVHRSYASNLYSLRQHFPPPRLVGPYEPATEDFGG
jgi:subtilase family serine protease